MKNKTLKTTASRAFTAGIKLAASSNLTAGSNFKASSKFTAATKVWHISQVIGVIQNSSGCHGVHCF